MLSGRSIGGERRVIICRFPDSNTASLVNAVYPLQILVVSLSQSQFKNASYDTPDRSVRGSDCDKRERVQRRESDLHRGSAAECRLMRRPSNEDYITEGQELKLSGCSKLAERRDRTG